MIVSINRLGKPVAKVPGFFYFWYSYSSQTNTTMEISLDRTITRVTPSGVEFSVRNLKGKDQRILTKQKEDSESSRFNKMLAGCLLTLGDKSGSQITEELVKSMLSNDRKFVLITLRQHSLDYQKEFKFNFEWPLQKGAKDKDLQSYVVNFDSKNFPVVPYKWMREELAQRKKDGDEVVYDGHTIAFPKLYESYTAMLADHRYAEMDLPDTKIHLRYELMNGTIESKYAGVDMTEMDANSTFEMHRCTYFEQDKDSADPKKGKWIMVETDELDLIFIEVIRLHIKDTEGRVDTMLAIQHQRNPARETRVDLIGLVAFFFPSQAI